MEPKFADFVWKQKLKLPKKEMSFPKVGQICSVAGWGFPNKNSEISGKPSLILRQMETQILTRCETFSLQPRSRICTLSMQKQSQTPADSGGPLICQNNLLTGVLSKGNVYKPRG